ncbi:MAG: GAF domain-containing protein [Phototrophicaceae bacterium]|jgi:GAF domain-containing protein
MLGWYSSIFDSSAYSALTTRARAQITYNTVLFLVVVFTITVFALPLRLQGEIERLTYVERAVQPLEHPLFTFGLVVFYLLSAVTVWQTRRGNLALVALGPSVMIYLAVTIPAVLDNIDSVQNGLLLLLPLLVAGLLDGERGLLLFVPVYFISLTVGYVRLELSPVVTVLGLIQTVIYSTVVIVLLYLFIRNSLIERIQTQVVSSAQRLQLANITTQITRSMSEVKDLDTVLDQIVHQVRDSFDTPYHVQVFLIDDNQRNALLVASTGEVGKLLLERRHRLPVGSQSVIGQVTQRQEPIIAQVGESNSVHRPNDLLPNTRLEVAIPLTVNRRNIGALDLQYTDSALFTEDDLVALQAVANSIAITIDNAQLLAQIEKRLDENRLLVGRMEQSQLEVERLNRELTGSIWSDYLRDQSDNVNLDLDFGDASSHAGDVLSTSIMQAIGNDEVVRREQGGQQIVAIPLRVRGEVIGAMEFEVDDDRPLTADDFDMLQEVGERLGLAAENNRLFATSQRVAQREALVNEISTRIQSANGVEATVSEAARSLRDALKATRVSIRLGTLNSLGAPVPPKSSN